jgi:hypothetical protein
MNLQTIHKRTAKWVGDTWEVADKSSYFWEYNGVQSPTFDVLTDALNWIIKYDEEKNNGNH